MIAKGYTFAPGGPCDLTLHYSISLDRRLEAEAMGLGAGGGTSKGWGREVFSGKPVGKRDTYVREIDRGTLVVEAVENAGGVVVWRGYGQADLKRQASDEQRARRLHGAIKSVLSSLPRCQAR